MNEFRSRIFGGRIEPDSLLGAKRPRGAKAEAGLISVSVPRSEARTSDTRDADRHRLSEEEAIVRHRGQEHVVNLINVSGGGAMIAGDFEANLWDRVDLQFSEGASVECEVRWIKGDRIGLEFAQETRIDCTPAELQKLLHSVVSRSFPEVAVEITGVEESIPETPEEPDLEEDHRRAERHPLIWSGTIHYDFTSTPVRLRNISTTGALIDCDFALPVGAEPLLDLGESGQVFATVTWRRGDQVGLAFNSPFDLQQLADSRPTLAPEHRNRPVYPRGEDLARETEELRQLSESEIQDRLAGFLKR